MSMFHSCYLLFDYFRFALIHGPSIPGSYVILFFTTPITTHIHNWVFCCCCCCCFVFFCFGSVSSIFLELYLHSSPYHIGHLLTWGVHLSVSYLFAFSYYSWGSQGKSTEVVCHSLLQWTTFCQNFPPRPIHLCGPIGIAHSFIELDKAVVHEISLISFL